MHRLQPLPGEPDRRESKAEALRRISGTLVSIANVTGKEAAREAARELGAIAEWTSQAELAERNARAGPAVPSDVKPMLDALGNTAAAWQELLAASNEALLLAQGLPAAPMLATVVEHLEIANRLVAVVRVTYDHARELAMLVAPRPPTEAAPPAPASAPEQP